MKKDLLKPYKGLPREIYVIFWARVINAAGLFVYPLLTLLLTRKIGLSDSEAGLWMSLTGLTYLPGSIIGGKLADTIGRKKIILICDSLGALGFIACAFMEPSMMMVFFIMFSGAMMGAAEPAHTAMMADLTTPENRDGAYSLSYLGFNIGFAVGPLVGGLLFENHLRLFFIIDAATALIAIVLIAFFIKETLGTAIEQDYEGRELEKHEDGSVFSVLLKRPVLIVFAMILMGYNFVYAQWGFLIPLHAKFNFFEKGASLYGMLASFNGLIVMFCTPVLTSMFSKKTNLNRLIVGGVLYVVGFGMLGFISTKAAFFVSVFIFTLGEILITISFMPFIANNTPASHRGRVNSILPIVMGVGYTISPLIIGNVIEVTSISFAWKLLGVVMIISTMAMYILERVESKKSRVMSGKIDDDRFGDVNV